MAAESDSTRPAELWKPVVRYEDRYEVSSTGRVRSLLGGGRVLKPRIAGGGYPQYSMSRPGKLRTYLVHNLVLEAFVGPRPSPKHVCRHLDGDPANNALTNLRWGTYEENSRDRTRHGRAHNRYTDEQILRVMLALMTGAKTKEIERTVGVARDVVCCIRRGAHRPDFTGASTDNRICPGFVSTNATTRALLNSMRRG